MQNANNYIKANKPIFEKSVTRYAISWSVSRIPRRWLHHYNECVVKFRFNWILIVSCKQKTIMSRDDLSAYISKDILFCIDIDIIK